MTDLRTAAQQALEALEWFRDTATCAADADMATEVIPALRAALEAQEEPPARKPLTQREVVAGFCETPHQTQYVTVFEAGVRFAERAHGIGGGE